jgi:predicted acylesterase/phospholipase RssA
MDLLLSSGFLAFARHCGVLKAIEEADLPIDAVIGTSSGAMIGALWAAGAPADEIALRISADTPWSLIRLRSTPWSGLFSMAPARERLAEWLPPHIEDLGRPFAAGVMTRDRCPRLLSSGPLVDAVVASCSMPWFFEAVAVDGEPLLDGGAIDRVGWAGWRALRGDRPVLAHVVDRSAGPEASLPDDLPVIRTPRSGARFWNLGDFAGQMEEARRLAHAVIDAM